MRACYEKLFAPINNEDSDNSTLSCILEKVFPTGNKILEVQIAFVIAICTTLLDPRNEHINVKESIVRCKIDHYLVGFCNFLYWYLLNWLIYLIFTDLFYILKNKLKNKETLQPYDDGVSEESEEEETEELRGGPCDQWLLVNI